MREPVRLSIVIGTRPEAIKLMPVIKAARARPDQFVVSIVRTGQHRDMVDQLLAEFGLEADLDLGIMLHGQDLAHVLAESVRGLSSHFATERPDWVLVQGDTTTTFAGALAAFYNGIPVGHVEAGLRTNKLDSPFPEEANRSMTARLADLHFAPTEGACANLRAEGIDTARVVMTGNTGIDALMQTLQGPCPASVPTTERYLFVTAHRRESHGAALEGICTAIATLLDTHAGLVAWVPMHPSPTVRSTLRACLEQHPRVRLTEPLGYRECAFAMAGATLVLTDSGGIQEECVALGKPVLVLREDTERPEGVEAGVSVVVGTETHRIVDTATRLLADSLAYDAMTRPSTVYGSGEASQKILDAIIEWRRHERA